MCMIKELILSGILTVEVLTVGVLVNFVFELFTLLTLVNWFRRYIRYL
jgi:hypothetical protein